MKKKRVQESSSESESESESLDYSDDDVELQDALLEGRLKPGLNIAQKRPKTFANDAEAMERKLNEIVLDLPWIEVLNSTTDPAPLAPELAAKMLDQEQRRENVLKNNNKLKVTKPEDDPVLNDFKREILFYRQAQATVLEAVPKIKKLKIPFLRPDDYFAEMAKSDAQMQKVRENLMKQQVQQQRVERVRQIRQQRKEGKAIQAQAKLARQEQKRDMLNQVKKVRKGMSKDLSFLDDTKKPKKSMASNRSKKSIEKRKQKDEKFGYGGKKRGSKSNTRDSSADVDYDKRKGKKFGGRGAAANKGKFGGGAKGKKGPSKRPGKSKRQASKAKGKRK